MKEKCVVKHVSSDEGSKTSDKLPGESDFDAKPGENNANSNTDNEKRGSSSQYVKIVSGVTVAINTDLGGADKKRES